MPIRNLSRSVRRDIQGLASTAHERELAAELHRLNDLFSQWQSGKLDPHELNDAIHRFHDGPSRDLWKTYTASDPSLAVASAIARGILQPGEVPPDVAQELHGTITALLDLRDNGTEVDDA